MNAFPDDVEISPEETQALHAAGEIQLIDVREPYEYELSRIEGSRPVELERLASQADTIDRDSPVVFYCRLGARSAMAANAFLRAGYEARSMAGGLERWHAEGRPLTPEGAGVAPH